MSEPSSSESRRQLPERVNSSWAGRHYAEYCKLLKGSKLILDCSLLQILDATAKAMLIQLNRHAAREGNKLRLDGMNEEFREKLLSLCVPTMPVEEKAKSGFFESAGETLLSLKEELLSLAMLFSESLYASTFGLFRRKTILSGSLTLQMISLGSKAGPIVFMLSFLIGLTLAFQSAVQLERFGASLYLASGIGISMITEIGPLMTAIILAGRSGSAVTAELATMTVQEEVKALRTMGIHPFQFLVLPRFWAMSLVMPLLTAASQLTGILAGLGIGIFYSKLPTGLFLSELRDAVTPTMIWQSMLKAEVFAWLIVLIAARRGLAVRGGSDAVGRATTACVVWSISSIILADAVFSFLFYW